MTSFKFLVLHLAVTIIPLSASALRIPASLDIERIRSEEQGFDLDYSNSSWTRAEVPENLKNQVFALFRLKGEDKATFTLRIDNDTKHLSLRDYAQGWLKSYPQFGLNILGHKNFKNKNDIRGSVIDLLSENSKNKVRQVIFFKNAKAYVLTCMGDLQNFSNTLKKCNELIENFNWIEKSPTSNDPLVL